MALPAKFTLVVIGSSLTTGRLSADWVPRLVQELPNAPEALGDIQIYNMGKGSQTSAYLLAQMPQIIGYQPTHVLFETNSINDCIDFGGGPAISRAAHATNIQTFVAGLQAGIPGVHITMQTMSTIGTAITATRPTYADYVADDVALASILSIELLDSYARWAAGVGSLPDFLCNNFDSLHPLAASAVDVYHYPYVYLWARQRLAALYGLTNPTAPILPTATDCEVLVIGGGGGGGDFVGGGGGAGGIIRKKALLSSLLGAVVVGAGGAAGSGNGAGATGTDSSIGGLVAKGGGGGGGYSSSVSPTTGKDGGSGGGGGVFAAVHFGGQAKERQGWYGGASDAVVNGSAGGGGGATLSGANGLAGGGQGGTGWHTDVPGDVQDVCAGGPGGSYAATRPAYIAGAGPTALGGGGRGGGNSGATTGVEGRQPTDVAGRHEADLVVRRHVVGARAREA